MENEILKADNPEVPANQTAKPVVNSTVAPIAKPIAKSVAKPIAKPSAKAVAKPVAKPVAKAVAIPVAKPVVAPVAKPVVAPVAKPVAAPVAAPVAEPVTEPVAKPDIKTPAKKSKEKPFKVEAPRIKKSKREKFNYELRTDLLGKAIKTARKERKLTQKELGQLVGVKKAQISKLENSLTDARLETIIKVFKALNVKINFNVELLDQTITLS